MTMRGLHSIRLSAARGATFVRDLRVGPGLSPLAARRAAFVRGLRVRAGRSTLAVLVMTILCMVFGTPSVFAAGAESPALSVGMAAPPFRLQDQHGVWHTLSEYHGNWLVLYFYPKDDTPGCTTQACEFRDNIFAFNQLGAVILGISVDDVDSHKEFADEHALPFTLLADSTTQTAAAYGVLHTALGIMEVASRETFIIDPQGRIAKHYTAVDPKGHSQAVLADLKALQQAAHGS